MLSVIEKEGCVAVLNLLPDDELHSLSQTVTMRQLRFTSREEAIEAVITYTEDALKFLKRKKIKREYLFRYVTEAGQIVSPASEKHSLMSTILKLWKSPNAGDREEQPVQNDDERVVQAAEAAENIPPPQVVAENIPPPQVVAQATKPSASSEQTMAFAFAQWFFQLLNAQNPTSNIESTEAFGTHHFYPDCKFQLISSTHQITKEEFLGDELTVKRLLAFMTEERLLFNPNLTEEGVKGMSEPHGLVVIVVCGVVHQNASPVGIFEQQFGLVSEPGTASWKIKFINLKLGAGGFSQVPTLKDTRDRLAIESR